MLGQDRQHRASSTNHSPAPSTRQPHLHAGRRGTVGLLVCTWFVIRAPTCGRRVRPSPHSRPPSCPPPHLASLLVLPLPSVDLAPTPLRFASRGSSHLCPGRPHPTLLLFSCFPTPLFSLPLPLLSALLVLTLLSIQRAPFSTCSAACAVPPVCPACFHIVSAPCQRLSLSLRNGRSREQVGAHPPSHPPSFIHGAFGDERGKRLAWFPSPTWHKQEVLFLTVVGSFGERSPAGRTQPLFQRVAPAPLQVQKLALRRPPALL